MIILLQQQQQQQQQQQKAIIYSVSIMGKIMLYDLYTYLIYFSQLLCG